MPTEYHETNLFQRLANAIPECVWLLDLDAQKITFVSPAYEQIWGRRVQDLLDDRMDWLRHVHPDDKNHMRQARNQAKSGGLEESFRIIRPDGTIRWLHLSTFPICDTEGHLHSIGGIASDITQSVTQQQQLKTTLQEQQLRSEMQRSILNALPACIGILDAEGVLRECNAAWKKLASDSCYAYHGIGDYYLSSCDCIADFPDATPTNIEASLIFANELRALLAGGTEPVSHIFAGHGSLQNRWYRITATPLHTQEESGIVIMYIDVTDNVLAEQRFRKLSHYDSLTELPNRRLFLERLSSALAIARRNGHPHALFFIDLDRFKAVNDTLGHSVGDELLKEAAARLLRCVRDCDTVCRLGGDEFALILSEMRTTEDATIVAQRILSAFATPLHHAGHQLFVTASIGITLFPQDSDNADTLIHHADTAMYRAKAAGRNKYQFFTNEMNEQAMRTMALERDLRQAIKNEEFLLYYQPKVCCHSGQIVGLEALLRWKHPQRGLVSPAEFIPVLEESGLIVTVGEWIMHTACKQAQTWHAAGLGTPSVAVNVSGQQMLGRESQDLCVMVQSALTHSGLLPEYLELELTESYLMQDAEGIIATLRKIKAMGAKISVDDFGTGYSSLAYLKRFPLDTLKVDRAFVRDITTDSDDASIAQAIISLAHSLKLNVVAEGVETAEQLGMLIEQHCDVMQGFLFSRPLPAEEITHMLQNKIGLSADLLKTGRQKQH